ncbi:MAG TPA: MFS transporter [Pirellulales bacterium]|nr:MFS transporter [Pirellulales bacterium]
MPPPATAQAEPECQPSAAVSGPRRLARPNAETTAFGWPFWLTYAANLLLMVAVSLLYRYGDFVTYLGGSEVNLGWVIAVGMVGSLAMRMGQGVGIDAYGPRQIWLWSSATFVAVCLAHLLVTDVNGPLIYVLRILFQSSLAGYFGASITYISGRAPVARIAEVVGTLGTSGFVGMVLGTRLGDHLLNFTKIDRGHVDRMFLAAALLGAVSFVLSVIATRGQQRPQGRKRLPMLRVLRRYHPGYVLLIAVATGFGISLPGVFLSRYAASLEIATIGPFFAVYCPTAFIARISMRSVPERFGIRPMIFGGMATLVCGMMLFLIVRQPWHFVFPAISIAIAHALLFPAMIASGSGAFPARYRGLGTTLSLAFFDFGCLVGSPIVGESLYLAKRFGWPAYPTMFVTVAAILACLGLIYAVSERRKPGVT